MINESIISHNYNVLVKLQEGVKLVADENGYLIEGALPQKSLISWLFSKEKDTTHKVINQTCQQIFDQIIRKNNTPLTADHPRLAQDRVKVKSILDGVAKLGQSILLPQLESDLTELVQSPETLEARLAIRQGINPQPLNQTISGTYIVHNRLGKPWGIFKPKRQEVGCDKNPSWILWATCNAEEWNIESGTGYLRECAAYQLDKDHFSDVPLTVPTNFTHRLLDTSILPLAKPFFEGSFQLFKKSCSPLINKLKPYEYFTLKPQNQLNKTLTTIYLFSVRTLFYLGLSHIPKDEIHKMAILDIRILNCDRHLANCLVENDSNVLFPIDHGLTLPNHANRLRFEWKRLIQSRLPLSEKALQYISHLDPNQDAKTLKNLGISSEAIKRMKLSTMLLKEAAAKGFTLYQIADLMEKRTSTNTYFEDVICYETLTKGTHPHLVISQAIHNYANKKNEFKDHN